MDDVLAVVGIAELEGVIAGDLGSVVGADGVLTAEPGDAGGDEAGGQGRYARCGGEFHCEDREGGR